MAIALGAAVAIGAGSHAGIARREDGAGSSAAPESKANIGKALPDGEANRMPDSEKIDELDTNNLLRAYSGSKSRWSVASTFIYNGGSLQTPLSKTART